MGATTHHRSKKEGKYQEPTNNNRIVAVLLRLILWLHVCSFSTYFFVPLSTHQQTLPSKYVKSGPLSAGQRNANSGPGFPARIYMLTVLYQALCDIFCSIRHRQQEKSCRFSRPPDKSAYWKIIFLHSQPKHMLGELKRTVSMVCSFEHPKHMFK